MQKTQEMQVWPLGWEDPLEEEMATHPNILAWGILWTEEPGGLQSIGLQRVRLDWAHMHELLFVIFCDGSTSQPRQITIIKIQQAFINPFEKNLKIRNAK